MIRSLAMVAALGAFAALPALADEALLNGACGGCHASGGDGLSRIAGQRKTPEGWLMTIVRMRIYHGIEVSPADQAQLVQYLSDTQGLAPSETEGWRYALEREPSVVEAVDEPLGSMCGRCHTNARVALQRRTAEEWELHMHFHVGQFPTIEYQAGGRDREWFKIAVEEVAPLLSEMYPLETNAWTAWQATEKRAPTGDWIVMTHVPGAGEAYGRMTVTGDASPYQVTGEMVLGDGQSAPVNGQMALYTGYEWRANLSIGDRAFRQVLAISEDGSGIAGRQFLRDMDSLGGPLTGIKADAGPALLGAVPSAVPAGEKRSVQFVGTGLDTLELEGVETEALAANEFGAVVGMLGNGNRAVAVSTGETGTRVGVYETVDRIAVEPDFTIARVGGGSPAGPGRVPAHFRAIGYWNGPDGEPGTEDDVRVGEIPAKWSVANNGEAAAGMDDVSYAGEMDAATGIFTPAVAGPNPARTFSTNNAGDLTVKAEALGLTGEGRLVVTVQRFVDPPIR